MQWSKEMEDLHRREVLQPVLNDRRTNWDDEDSISLGYPFNVIRNEVIQLGLADFRIGHNHKKYGELTAEDKVLLYCFANMKLHFFETLATFRRFKETLEAIYVSKRKRILLDLGCGPGTAGLALADCLEQPKFFYVGLDRAKPMLKKAASLLDAALNKSLIEPTSTIATTSSWANARKVSNALSTAANVHINATYLFASDSLDIDDVCNLVTDLNDNVHVKRLVLTYSNSNHPQVGIKFTLFKRRLKGQFRSSGLLRKTIEYQKKRSSNATGTATYLRELLVFKEG